MFKKTKLTGSVLCVMLMLALVCGCGGKKAAPAAEGTDLADYYGKTIDDIAGAFPDLQYDDSYKTSVDATVISGPTDTMEKMSDGLALAGPYFAIDNDGKVVGVRYGGKKYKVCGITAGIPVSEAADIAKSNGYRFSSVEVAHGTAKYVAMYENGEAELSIVSDADGDFYKTEESDVTGNVDDLMIWQIE